MQKPDLAVEFLLSTVGIPELNELTIKHVHWRANMLLAHWNITGCDIDVLSNVLFGDHVPWDWLSDRLGARCEHAVFRTHVEFCKVMLTPPYSKLSKGMAGGGKDSTDSFEPHDVAHPES